MKVLVFDTETTGLPKNMKDIPKPENLQDWPHIGQISFIVYNTDNARMTSLTDHIIRLPNGVQISDETAAIHGITNEISQLGFPVEIAINEFMGEFANADIIVAHNIEFDRKLILAELYRMKNNQLFNGAKVDEYINTVKTSAKYLCTMQESIELCNIKAYTKVDKKMYTKWPTLSELYQHLFNYEPKNLHNSLNDVVVCLRCFYKIRFNKDICDENESILQMITKLK